MKNKITKEWLDFFHTLNESQRRRYAAIKAKELGFGGISKVHKATGLSRVTVQKGIRELENLDENAQSTRIRKSGGGRKKVEEAYPDVLEKVANLLQENKIYQEVADELSSEGHAIHYKTVKRVVSDNKELKKVVEDKIRELDRISKEKGGVNYESLDEAKGFFDKKSKVK